MLTLLVVGGGSHSLGLSSGGGEVHRSDPLHLERGLMSWRRMRLGHDGCLLAGELALPLRCLTLSVGLLSVGSCSLPLPKSVSSLEGEVDVQPWCDHPRWNLCHGLSGRNILQSRRGHDGSRQSPRVVPPGDMEVGASLSA
jgi:hypothetical protein